MKNLNKFLVVLFILAIVSLPIYIYKQNLNSFKYNGYSVTKTYDNTYNIEIYFKNDLSPHYISTRYDPSDLEYIKIEPNLKNKLLKEEIYITLTPNLTSTSVVALAEISKITSNQFLYNIPTFGAFTYPTVDNPIKTCGDVDYQTAIVLLKLGDETAVNLKDHCIIVQGINEDEIIKAGTRLTLTTLGIMNE